MKPTREQIRAALEWFELHDKHDETGQAKMICAAYRATRQPAEIIGRGIVYILAAAKVLVVVR